MSSNSNVPKKNTLAMRPTKEEKSRKKTSISGSRQGISFPPSSISNCILAQLLSPYLWYYCNICYELNCSVSNTCAFSGGESFANNITSEFPKWNCLSTSSQCRL
mmetsp:Transcript_30942/g.65864  ORF Transcript_30942/g.65864 Transcript_30942/m.65864 type:complete len:105 (-) Transcript_30942:188-502(-)